MAKKRKSVFNSENTDKKAIEIEAKKIEKRVLNKTEKVEKMHLYVDKEHHRKAKFAALKMGMKLGEYIEYLIEQHADD